MGIVMFRRTGKRIATGKLGDQAEIPQQEGAVEGGAGQDAG